MKILLTRMTSHSPGTILFPEETHFLKEMSHLTTPVVAVTVFSTAFQAREVLLR